MAQWHTAQTAAAQWNGAPATAELTALLEAAKEQCIAFAPVVLDDPTQPDNIPSRYPLAQLYQARALWQSQRTGPGDSLDASGQTVRVYPMDWQVKALLRPATGFPGIA